MWLIIFAMCLMFAGIPQLAYASKSLPADVVILLGFKERYGDTNKQHLGIDVYAKEGSEVRAPAGGTISFVGRVPGSAGLNVTALTITTEDGQQISVNPFATTKMKRGDSVVKGQVLGTVSAVGDPSSPESHFHLSLRVNGVYRDPTHLLMVSDGVVSEKGSSAALSSVPSLTPNTALPKPPAVTASSTVNQPAVENSGAKAQVGSSQEIVQRGTEVTKVGQKASAKTAATSNMAAANAQRDSAKTYSGQERPETVGAGRAQEKTSASKQNLKVKAAGQGTTGEQEIVSSAASNVAPNASDGTVAAQGASAAERSWQRLIVGPDPTTLSSASLYSGQGASLHIKQSASLGLQAELINYLKGMSQTELSASIIAFVVLMSCVGFGVVKIAQVMGVDAAILKGKERLARFDELVQGKGGLGDET